MEDTLGRRKRFARKSLGKTIELTERDLAVFQLLHRYRYLRSTFIWAFIGGDKIRLIKRLGDLYHEGYLERPAQQWQTINARYSPCIYELGKKGREVLSHHGLTLEATSMWVAKDKIGREQMNLQFWHTLLICDILASIELGVKERDDLRYISWQEIISRAPEQTRTARNPFEIPCNITHTFKTTGKTISSKKPLVPDALFGIGYTSPEGEKCRFFALEADRATMPLTRNNLNETSYLRKLVGYLDILARETHKTHLGISSLYVLTVTTSDRHKEGIIRLLDELTEGKGNTRFGFKAVEALGSFERAPEPTPAMLEVPWKRAGNDPLDISSL